jgi:protein-L-isoaspartate(D-aspartate) O-methyltransferase
VRPAEEAETKGVPEPAGWHYQRQLTLVTAADAPEGKAFARFHNAEAGRGCQALQGFAVDGRKVTALKLSLAAKGENISADPASGQTAQVVISFYDERRAVVGEESLGPFQGTFAWRRQERQIRVPLRAREAIIRIGLLGAVGDLCLDDVQVRAAE